MTNDELRASLFDELRGGMKTQYAFVTEREAEKCDKRLKEVCFLLERDAEGLDITLSKLSYDPDADTSEYPSHLRRLLLLGLVP